jgi:hypothetical protein
MLMSGSFRSSFSDMRFRTFSATKALIVPRINLLNLEQTLNKLS